MNCLVTGGAGFIGSHICDRLIADGHKVFIIDNLLTGNPKNIEGIADKVFFCVKDIRNIKKSSLKNIDVIFHQAARRSVPQSFLEPEEYYDVNVIGTINLIQTAKKCGVKKIIMASSSSVYGDCQIFPQSELLSTHPISPYAGSKLSMEHIATMFNSPEMPLICLRYFNVYGERQPANDDYASVIPKFIKMLSQGQPPTIYGDGNQERDFTYVGDVVEANIRAVEGKAGVYNIGNGSPTSVNRLTDILRRIIRDVEPIYQAERKGDVKKTHADISKAEIDLLWKPQTTIEEGLERTAKWLSVS